MPSDIRTNAHDLETVRRHRAELRGSASALELALAAPIPGRSVLWSERLRAALMELLADFREHVDITEGPKGLYTRVLKTAPRLASSVQRLTQEHDELTARITDLLDALEGTPPRVDFDQVRELGTVLLGRLVRHRQRGSDLIYEAYTVDIGGEE